MSDYERKRWIANVLTVMSAKDLNEGQRAMRLKDAYETAYLLGRTDALREAVGERPEVAR